MIVYFYLDKIMNVILIFLNFLLRLYGYLDIGCRKIIKRNEELKRKVSEKQTEECFILGNGPSLRDVDLNLLKDKDTFTVNYFYRNEKEFRSTYHVIIDDIFYDDRGEGELINIYKEHPDTIFLLKYASYKRNKDLYDLNRTYFTLAKQFQYGKYVVCDMTKNMTACINVVLHCIQCAIYMGYKKIYLLGCDFNAYAQLKTEHFYDAQERVVSMGDDARWSSMAHYHHYALQEYASKIGVEIINLTPGSLIDAYKRDTLENVLGNSNE